jgi:outer membrane murein-binding lipoprotein Lpp
MAQDPPFTPAQERTLRALVSRQLRLERAALCLLAVALAAAALVGAGALRAPDASGAREGPPDEVETELSELRARGDALAAGLDALRAEFEARSRQSARASEGRRQPLPPGEAAPLLERLYNLEVRHDALDRARESFERGVLARLHNVETSRDRAETERVSRERALLGRLANVEERLYSVEARSAAPGAALPASRSGP